MPTQTRAKMISAAVGLLQRHGLAAMSFSDVLAESGAARGAIYHHFPGGKRELAAVAAANFGADVRGYLSQLPFDNPVQVVDAFIASVRPVLEGRPLAAAARSQRSPKMAMTTTNCDWSPTAAFTSWASELTDKLHRAGDGSR